MKAPLLTREALLDGSAREYILRNSEMRRLVLPDADREASLRATLKEAPAGGDVWVFGYGSLIWNPAFHFVEKRTARIHGYHRRFCLWTPLWRGSAENPGLMLGLERGGACSGVMFRIAQEAVDSELDILWRREMFTGAYRPTWVSVRSHGEPFPAITFVINRDNSRYAGRSPWAPAVTICSKPSSIWRPWEFATGAWKPWRAGCGLGWGSSRPEFTASQMRPVLMFQAWL